MTSLTDDLTKATNAAERALKDAEAQAKRIAEVRDLLAKVPAAEQELAGLMAAIKEAHKEKERLDLSIQQARDRYLEAKVEAAKARKEADDDIQADGLRYAESHKAHDAAMKGLAESLERTKDYVEREQAALLDKLKPISDLMTQFHQQRQEWQARLAG